MESNPDRRRRRAGLAKGRPIGWSGRRARSPAGEGRRRPCGWGRHKASRLRNASGASEALTGFDAVLLALVDHRHEANDAAVAAIPVPREEREGAALAGHGVEIAADVLDAENAVGEE